MVQKTNTEESQPSDATDQATAIATSFPRGFRSLEKLRDRVELASIELARLRDENAELVKRIAFLQQESNPGADKAIELELEEDPQLLRKKIDAFITAIDEYLESEKHIAPSEPEAS